MLERWAKDNGVLWVDGEAVTSSNLDGLLFKGSFCVLALENNIDGKHGLCICGDGLKLRNDALEMAKKQQTEQTDEGSILLDLPSVQPPRKLPVMEF